MDSQAAGLSKTENDTAVATLGPVVCGHATAGASREDVPDIVWLPQYGGGNRTHDGHYTYAYDPENRLTQVVKPDPAPQQLNSFAAYTKGGDAVWTADPSGFAQSGDIDDDQESWMYIDVSGPGTVQFQWKVSSEQGYDFLEFYIDGYLANGRISGEVDWTQKSYSVTGSGTHRLKWRYAKDGSFSAGSDCGWVKTVVWTPTLLGSAVDSLLTYTTGGSANWSITGPGHADGDCARSGSIGDGQQSWLQTTVEGAGTLSFWWKVSSESDCDHLEFYLDGQLQSGRISGEEDWAQKTCTLSGSGVHTLQWRYQKDGGSSEGSDCGWVDDVQWSGSIPQPPEPLRLYIDGVESYGCRTGSWEQKSYTITGSGTHTLKWLAGRYTPDWSGTGYVDYVQWTGYTPTPPAPPEPLRFYVDEVESYGCRTGSWEQKSYTITGSGPHTLKWLAGRYTPDWSGAGYVDEVQWTGSMPPVADAWGTLNYLYDASGRRIEKRIDGRTITKYLYDGDSCIAEYDAGGTLRRKYIYGPCIDEPICMIETTQSYAGTYYYHFDALGSVVALTSGNAGSMGNTVEVYEYDVYGRVGASDPNHPNRFLFTGREYDKETGLYYYRARYYNPQIGRFLQTDPIGYGDGMNCYRYCGNSPTGLTDPSGCGGFSQIGSEWYTCEFTFPALAIGAGITTDAQALTMCDWFFTADQWTQWDSGWIVDEAYVDGNDIHVRFKWQPYYTGGDFPAPSAPNLKSRNVSSTCAEPVITLNGIGLLTFWKFLRIVQPDMARVDSWSVRPGGPFWYPSDEEKDLLRRCCDTPFRNSGVHMWEFGKQIYDRSQVNYWLEGYAMHHFNYDYVAARNMVLHYKNTIREKGAPRLRPGDLKGEYTWFDMGWVSCAEP